MRRLICWLLWMSLVGWAWGQQASSTSGTVPTVIRFSGNLAHANGKPQSGMLGVTFSLYGDQQGGAPLWVETQNVQADNSGHYMVRLGSTSSHGLPQTIFTSGEARWLGVQPQGQAEQPRVLLMSVPYALKAADAETLGGKPLSAFQLAAPLPTTSSRQKVSPPAEQLNEILCSGGAACKANFIPKFSTNGGSAKVNDSIIRQTGTNIAIAGSETVTSSGSGPALVGQSSGTNSGSDGVHGVTSSGTASGVAGVNTTGVGNGVYGSGGVGVYGATSATLSGTGVVGVNNFADPGGIGVGGYSNGGEGVHGETNGGIGVTGFDSGTSSSGTGVYGNAGGYGVRGISDNIGVYGVSPGGVAVWAHSLSGQAFVADTGGNDTADTLVSINNGGGFPFYVAGTGGGVYVDANGNLFATGSINGSSKNFRIDHPLDPANKYLYHASVESSEMKNIYDGVAVLDADGTATIQLPDWFEAVNTDFRYQLTAIGSPAPNLHIAQEIANHQFQIAGGQPGLKASWQVTGVRHDAFAKAHPLQVSVDKPANERGYYIHPELHGAPKEKGITSARHPELMKRTEERPIQTLSHRKVVVPTL